MVIKTDRIRLKQIILNLAGNSRKFVQQGYIRLSACIVNGKVQLAVEDSGPGIPVSKRKHLFQKYQESLDSLSQGTGMGLCLCKNLANLLGAELDLDETFESGLAGCPGARFVLTLNNTPILMDAEEDSIGMETSEKAIDNTTEYSEATVNSHTTFSTNSRTIGQPPCRPIQPANSQESTKSDGGATGADDRDQNVYKPPENLSVLIVDDDMVLRRLITRTFKRVAPSWDIMQAANGETALRLTDNHNFDVIFLDQYMSSVEKQLLGTETTRELRAKGVTARICGLSANNMEESFLKAGANAFMQKPIPCKTEQISEELRRVLQS